MYRYLRYEIENREPVRIADDASSQSGQTTTLRYIPGTTIRGLVVSALAGRPDFPEMKKALFSTGVRYLNAYISREGKELLPSPKGFYEDKKEAAGKKKMENVAVKGDFTEGWKRAALGRFALLEGDTVRYYNVDTGSDLKIKMNVAEEDKNVFRNEYITAGNRFVGYIAVEIPELEEAVKGVFAEEIILGNARSAGFGRCRVVSAAYVDRLPYDGLLPKESQEGSCYMLLLSNLAMRDGNGELCGLNREELERLMGVEELKTAFCATSTVDVRGYNRTWGIHTPSAAMYEQGSVFHFTYRGALSVEKMAAIADSGIGIRRNEGFGRVLFLDQYEKVEWKEKGEENRGEVFPSRAVHPEDEAVLKLAAGNYYRNIINRKMVEYVVGHPLQKGGLAGSQLGRLEALTTAYKYDSEAGRKAIDRYFAHAKEKEQNRKTQKARSSVSSLNRIVTEILDADLDALLGLEAKESVMGVRKADLLTTQDVYRLKMKLLTELIRYDNKKEGENGNGAAV